MTYDITEEVLALSNVSFEGNIIPIEWFSYIKLANEKPDIISILILADIVYWYRPSTVRDEASGRVIEHRKKFKADLLQRSYKEFESQFGLSRDQIRDSLQRLEQVGLIKRIFRNIDSQNTTLYNVMFIQIFPSKIIEITNNGGGVRKYPNTSSDISHHLLGNILTPLRIYPNTYTQTTTEITTDTKSLSKSQDNDKSELLDINERERELIKIWNEVVEEGKKEISATDDRLKLISRRFEDFFSESIVEWTSFCKKINTSKFLMGEVTAFKASLDWALEPKSIVKILEGDYGIGDRLVREERGIESITGEDLIREIRSTDCPDFWKQIKESLLISEGRDTYISWFRKLEFLRYEEGILELKASTKFIALQLEQQFANPIKRAALKFLRGFKKVKIKKVIEEAWDRKLNFNFYSSENTDVFLNSQGEG